MNDAGYGYQQTAPLTREVEIFRVEPIQAGKLTGLLYVVGSLFMIPFLLLGGLAGAMAPQQNGGGAVPAVVMFVVAAIIPVIYGVLGFVAGIVMAFVYNLAAGWIGGFRISLR